MVVRVYTYTARSDGDPLTPRGKERRGEGKPEWKTKALRRRWAGEKARNKNTNRNKVGFAFDKHRKKAQRKVITYTSASYDGLRRSALRPGTYLVCHSSSRSPALAISSTTESRSGLRKKMTPEMVAVLLTILLFGLLKWREKRERERRGEAAYNRRKSSSVKLFHFRVTGSYSNVKM